MFNFFIETKGHTILSIQVYKCIQKEINLFLGLMWELVCKYNHPPKKEKEQLGDVYS